MEIKTLSKFKYRVKDGDTLSEICSRFNTSKENIFRNNNNIDLFVGEWIEITVNEFLTHIVKPTQTLSQIAQMYNVDVSDIIEFNNLKTDKTYIGQILKINNKNK